MAIEFRRSWPGKPSLYNEWIAPVFGGLLILWLVVVFSLRR